MILRRTRIAIATVTLLAVLALSISVLFLDNASQNSSSFSTPHTSGKNFSTTIPSNLVAVPPATMVPLLTPVQMQYDEGFVKSFSGGSQQTTDALNLKMTSPKIGSGWPDLPVAVTPESWSVQFVTGLLNVNFARQSRNSLGSWLEAEEAPEDLPGVPQALQDRTLFISVLYPEISQQVSPMPSEREWVSNARNGVVWKANDVKASIDPQWQAMINAGWQPSDLRMTTEDVSGFLGITEGGATAEHMFSLTLVVGSAHWHNGYGSVLVSNWSES